MATRTTEDGFVAPVLHLNGTGHRNLFEQYHAALEALLVAQNKLVEASPHARDYYICDDYGEAFDAARRQHEGMWMSLNGIVLTVGSILNDIEEQERERRKARGEVK